MAAPPPLRCPACAFEQNAGDECARCGIVFSKFRERPAVSPTEPVIEVLAEYEAEPAARAWKLFGIGALAALVAHALPFVRFVLSPLVTLLHELGHAATAWALGCPAVPAFDFAHGGGITHWQSFQRPLAMLIGAGWLVLGWIFRRNPRALVAIGSGAALWLLAVSTEWRREVVIAAMGHGGELLLGGALLWMALSGRGWRLPAVERPLGAFAGWFVVIETLRFAARLTRDAGFVATYREGKGGAMMHDLEVIALDIEIWTAVPLEIEQVAAFLLLATLATPLAAAALFTLGDRADVWARSLLALER